MPPTQSSYKVMAFNTTHDAMSAQKLLKDYHVIVMPTPRSITTDCGISLKIDNSEFIDILRETMKPEWERLAWKIYKIMGEGQSELLYESD